MHGESPDNLVAGFEAVQDLLPKNGGFAIGGNQLTIADLALLPFLGRTELMLQNGVGTYQAAEGKKLYKQLFEDEKFARLQKYYKEASAKDSWKKTFYPVSCSFSFTLPWPLSELCIALDADIFSMFQRTKLARPC